MLFDHAAAFVSARLLGGLSASCYPLAAMAEKEETAPGSPKAADVGVGVEEPAADEGTVRNVVEQPGADEGVASKVVEEIGAHKDAVRKVVEERGVDESVVSGEVAEPDAGKVVVNNEADAKTKEDCHVGSDGSVSGDNASGMKNQASAVNNKGKHLQAPLSGSGSSAKYSGLSISVSAPPMPVFAALRTWDELMSMADEYNVCLNMEDIQKVTKDLSVFKQAANAMKLSLKSATQELTSAHRGREKAIADSEKQRKKAVDKDKNGNELPVIKRRKAATVIDAAVSVGEPFLTWDMNGNGENSCEAMKIYNGSEPIENVKPMVIHGFPDGLFASPEGETVLTSLEEFMSDFAESPLRDNPGRAMRRNRSKENAEDDAAEWLRDMPKPDGVLYWYQLDVQAGLDPAAVEKFRDQMSLANFGQKKDTLLVQLEKMGQATFRLHWQGTKRIAACRSEDLMGLMKRRGVTGSSLQDFFRDQREQGIGVMQEAGVTVWHATVGPLQAVFMPAGFIVAEEALQEDVFGIRAGVVVLQDSKHKSEVAQACAKPTATASSTCTLVHAFMTAESRR